MGIFVSETVRGIYGGEVNPVTSCAPFRGRGPRSGEGVLEGKQRNDTLS